MKLMKQMLHKACRIVVFTVLLSLLSAGGAWSADVVGKFQVVPGNEDTAFLLDTTTGAVWILTHRTMATGREPVAIPYKFIQISPQNPGKFLVERPPGGGIGAGNGAKEQTP
jgi:hypothetical protein